jgi:hypothetical protein
MAAQLDDMARLETAMNEAKTAYRDSQTPETRAAHRAASQALADARDEARSGGLMVATKDPGSATIVPATVKVG